MAVARKTPILLRRGPISGDVLAIHRYSRIQRPNGDEMIKAALDGKQDVTADYDALVLMELVDDGAEDIVGILDGVADGELLNDEERGQVRVFRERLKALVERHNARVGTGMTQGGVAISRRWRVYCTQFASCKWSGYRQAMSREEATAKPCPQCGKDVTA